MMMFGAFLLVGVFPLAPASRTLITKAEGDDVVLPCLLDPDVDVSESPVTWSKDDAKNIVHVYVHGRDRVYDQMEAFRNRTGLFHEGLREGNVSLRLSSVRSSDSGAYMCYIRRLNTHCHINLTVVEPGQLIRPQGSFSNKTMTPLEPLPKAETDGEKTKVCDFKCTVSITLGVVLVVLLGLGMFVIRKKIQADKDKKESEKTTNTELQNLSDGTVQDVV